MKKTYLWLLIIGMFFPIFTNALTIQDCYQYDENPFSFHGMCFYDGEATPEQIEACGNNLQKCTGGGDITYGCDGMGTRPSPGLAKTFLECKKLKEEARGVKPGDGNTEMEDPYDGAHIGDKICEEERVVKALKALGIIIVIAKFAIPIIIIFKGTLDLVKTINTGTTDSLTKQVKGIGMRVVVGLMIFFAPSILNAVMNGLTSFNAISEDVNKCTGCLLAPFAEGNCLIYDRGVKVVTSSTNNSKGAEAGSLNISKTASGEINNERSATAPSLDVSKSATAPTLNNERSATANQGDNTNSVSINEGNTTKEVVITRKRN